MDIQIFMCNSSTWYTLVLSSSLIYFVFAILSTLFTKESGFLKFNSVFHDNMVICLAVAAVYQRFLSTRTFYPLEFNILTASGWSLVSTCEVTAYVHFYLQFNCLLSLVGLLYTRTSKTSSKDDALHDEFSDEDDKLKNNVNSFCSKIKKLALSLRSRCLCLPETRRHGNPRLVLWHAKRFIIYQWCSGLGITLIIAFSGFVRLHKTFFFCCFMPLRVNIFVRCFLCAVFASNLFTILFIFWLTKNRVLRMLASVNHKQRTGDARTGFTI